MISNYELKRRMTSFNCKHQYSKFRLRIISRCMNFMKLCIDTLCTAFEAVSIQILILLKQAMKSNLVQILKRTHKQSEYCYFHFISETRYYKIVFDFTPIKKKKWPIHQIGEQHVWEIVADKSISFDQVWIHFKATSLKF